MPLSIHWLKVSEYSSFFEKPSVYPTGIRFFRRNSMGSMPMALQMSSMWHSPAHMAWGMP